MLNSQFRILIRVKSEQGHRAINRAGGSRFHRPAQAVILDRRRNRYDFRQNY
jgi:hypothetical protein